MGLIDRPYRLSSDGEGAGLACNANGVSLAGVRLLHRTSAGFAPRPVGELDALLKSAYGMDFVTANLPPGLRVVAQALNQGDLARATIATVLLRLPEVTSNGAARIADTDQRLAKYSPDEPRDWHGRWTTGDGSGSAPASDSTNSADGPAAMKPIPVSDPGEPGRERVCYAASRQCAGTAAADKSRTPYLSKCFEAEDACILVLKASSLDPDREFGVVFPDKTVVKIQDGVASVTYVGGLRLGQPLQ